jgi:hypothetical protein
MISAETAIHRARRDLRISWALNAVLLLIIPMSVLLRPVFNVPVDAMLALTVVGAVWVVLGIRSLKSSRMVADSPSLIAAGQYEAAERHIDGALRSFSIFRAVKLLSLHHLAALRHAQRRWREAAMLCNELLAQRAVTRQGLGRATRLILADSLLEMEDLAGAGECVTQLYQQRLSLSEALSLLLVQLDYESRLGAWQAMMTGAPTKVSMAELMPTPKSARTQALLALAAKKLGRGDWESWLRRRVELLVDPQDLTVRWPMLRELWLA